MSTSINIHRVEEITVERVTLSGGTHTLDIIVTDGKHITEITLFSDKPLTIKEN